MKLQEAYDKLAASGGGILPVAAKVYKLTKSLNIHANNVKIIGQGVDKSILMGVGINAIEITKNGAALKMEGVSVRTRKPKPLQGMGVYVYPKLTVDIHLDNCHFATALNSIRYRNHPDKTSLGSIVIRNCQFPRSSTKTAREFYYEGLPHKVMLWGAKTADKLLDVSYNRFSKHPKQRNKAIELCIWGDPTNGMGNGPMTMRKGLVVGNTFKGATRECLAVSDHQYFVVAFNDISDSKRVGLYVIRGYRTNVMNNIVRGSSYRGHRVAHLTECMWSWNEVYDSGTEDNTKVGVGGMHISNSRNNIITNNIIRASKGYAVALNNGSKGNRIFNNKILGSLQEVFVDSNSRLNEYDFQGVKFG